MSPAILMAMSKLVEEPVSKQVYGVPAHVIHDNRSRLLGGVLRVDAGSSSVRRQSPDAQLDSSEQPKTSRSCAMEIEDWTANVPSNI